MTRFEIKVSVDGTICELRVIGDVDLASADEFAEIGLLGLRNTPVHTLVIDLGAVSFLDSTGMGALVSLRNEALNSGTALRLRNVPDRVRKVLEIAGLDVVFLLRDEFRTSGEDVLARRAHPESSAPDLRNPPEHGARLS